jgi:hypothetical protein
MEGASLVHSVLRIACLILSLFTCTLLFLREDEEKKLQNSLDGLWIRVNDAGRSIGSFLAAFLAEVAKITGIGIDRLFGPALVSNQAIGVAVAFGLASMMITAWVASDLHYGRVWIAVAALIVVGILPAITKSADAARKVFLVPFALGLFFLGLAIWHAWRLVVAPESLKEGTTMLLAFYVFFGAILATVIVDVLWILLIRGTLEWFVNRPTPLRSLAFLTLNALALAVSLLPLFEYNALTATVHLANLAGWLAFFIICLSSTRIFMFLTAFAIAWLVADLLVHRITWPVIDRVVYAAARYKLVQNKKALASLATALLVAGAWNAKPLFVVLNLFGLTH